MKTGMSVIIVCFNSRQRIRETLAHLAMQESVNFHWEVILVDNNSNDNTAGYAQDFWVKIGKPCPFIVVEQPTQGISYARKKGIQQSQYRYLLFCDDDNWLSADYVATAYYLINKDHETAAIGGRGVMTFEEGIEPPVWINKYEKSYACGAQGIIDGDNSAHKGCLYGAGIVIDRIWLDKLHNLGFLPSLSGRMGKSLIGGEDTELTYALRLIGGKLHYSSKMVFRHYLPGHRLTISYLRKLWFGFGYTDMLISPYWMRLKSSVEWAATKKIIFAARNFFIHLLMFIINGRKNDEIHLLNFLRSSGEMKALFVSFGVFRKNLQVAKKLSQSNIDTA